MSPPGGNATHSSTVRLAAKEDSTRKVDPALLRITVTALCELARAAGEPMRRKVARAYVSGRVVGGQSPAEILRGARNEFGVVDETGETATRNVDRKRGGAG